VNQRRIRPDRDLYYCHMALAVAERGTCLRRRYGAVITNGDMTEVVSTGYAGAPRETDNCIDRGTCAREALGANPGDRYDLCRSVHAEMNAIIHAARREMIGGNLFLAGADTKTGELKSDADACRLCKCVIINAGIENVFVLVAPNEVKRINVRSDWIDRQHEVLDPMPGGGY